MLTSLRPLPCLVIFAVAALFASQAEAQQDRIYPKNGNPISGSVEMVTKDGITVKSGANTEAISVDKIGKVLFDGDPSSLTRGREFVLDGQYEQGMEELKKIDMSKIRRDVIKTDAEFYQNLAQAQLAMVGQGDRVKAVQSMVKFYKDHPDSWHYAEAVKTIGDLARAMGNYAAAKQFYGYMNNVSARSLKIESLYLTALTQLGEGDADKALEAFDKIIAANADSTETIRLQQFAKAGRVAALGLQGNTEQAISESDALVKQLDATDTELTARIYNARGTAFEKAGKPEDASIAFLHTTLLSPGVPDAHAEALSRLVPIWNELGHSERANASRQELQQRYPGWEG